MGIANEYGYKDPTALMAIENIMREQRRKEHVKEITKKAYEKWRNSKQSRKKKQEVKSRNM